MQLYLMRHGHAEDAGAGMDDHDRRLTENGKARIAAAGRVLKQLSVRPDTIFSSPRVRALQTAEIVAEALGIPVQIREEVNFGFSVAGIQTLTSDLPHDASAMFVGHDPSMSMVVGQLSGAEVSMKKGGLARIDLFAPEASKGELVWLIAPKVFDALDDE
jgi:phosphohistidine phosphatase